MVDRRYFPIQPGGQYYVLKTCTKSILLVHFISNTAVAIIQSGISIKNSDKISMENLLEY